MEVLRCARRVFTDVCLPGLILPQHPALPSVWGSVGWRSVCGDIPPDKPSGSGSDISWGSGLGTPAQLSAWVPRRARTSSCKHAWDQASGESTRDTTQSLELANCRLRSRAKQVQATPLVAVRLKTELWEATASWGPLKEVLKALGVLPTQGSRERRPGPGRNVPQPGGDVVASPLAPD